MKMKVIESKYFILYSAFMLLLLFTIICEEQCFPRVLSAETGKSWQNVYFGNL